MNSRTTRLLAIVILPAIALLLAVAAGFLKWEDSSRRDAQRAQIESVSAARESTVALLTYKAATAEQDLGAARDRLTGAFLDAYTQLINGVVIPEAKRENMSASADVLGAASVLAEPGHVVVLVMVNQTTTVAAQKPTTTASSVRVTLDKVGDRWLISGFDPV